MNEWLKQPKFYEYDKKEDFAEICYTNLDKKFFGNMCYLEDLSSKDSYPSEVKRAFTEFCAQLKGDLSPIKNQYEIF